MKRDRNLCLFSPKAKLKGTDIYKNKWMSKEDEYWIFRRSSHDEKEKKKNEKKKYLKL